VGRHSRWHGLLIAGAIALALTQTVQAAPRQLPEVTVPQVSVPSVPLPQVSVPSVTTPQVSVPGVPQVSVPSVTTPQVSTPQVSTPRVSTPQVSVPSVPRVSVPSRPTASRPRVPQVATSPLSNRPAPTRKQQLAQRPQAGSRGAAVAPTGSSGATRSSGASGSSRDRKAGAKARDRRARRIAREPSSKRLRRLLKPLDACVATLKPLQERVLVRRAGLRGFKPQTRRELAKSLHTSRTRIARIERRGLGNVRRAIRAGGCATPASSAAAPGTPGPSSGGLVADRVAAPAQSGGGASGERVAVKGVAESKSSESMVDSIAGAGRGALATISDPARSYLRDHPLTLVLAVLATALCGVLLVRERRRTV
jgi:hypothetical protein